MAWALLIIRLVVGLTLTAHGMQKFLGWFGGPGFEKVSRGFDGRGLKPGWLWAGLAVLGEVGGGLALALGFLTPLGAAGGLGAMAMAIQTHWKKGFFNSKGGFEYPLVLLAMSLALGIAGAGAYSLDSLFNIALPEVPLFGILAVAAIIVDVVGIFLSRSAVASPPASPASAA
jgi:putative oxidoreductase